MMAFPAAALAEGLCQGLGPKSRPATSQRLWDWDWMVGSSVAVRSDLVPRRPAHQGPRSPTFNLPASHPFEGIRGWFPVFWESLMPNVSKSRKEVQVMGYIVGENAAGDQFLLSFLGTCQKVSQEDAQDTRMFKDTA